MSRHVLVVDDDGSFRFAVSKALKRRGFEVSEACGGAEALEALSQSRPADVALLDLRMADMDGLDVLRAAGRSRTCFIVLTGHGSVEAAVDAMKLGAFSFLEKPVDADVLVPLLQQAIEDSNGRPGAAGSVTVPTLIGNSEPMNAVREFVQRVGPTNETVALYGETGTGKEVVARHLHLSGTRAALPFVALNAATVQRELFESELFGHRKGAFTGAQKSHRGMFGEADGGTLFIDEVAELPMEVQAKLLRALETGAVRQVGESNEQPVDVRIIAATNRDLWSGVSAGRFREDLFFRLQVVPVVLPPLRNRPEDIAPLVTHLLERIGAGHLHVTDEGHALMRRHAWPGNVRELLNVLRRSALFADGQTLDGALVQRMLAASGFAHGSARPGDGSVHRDPNSTRDDGMSSLAEVERSHIEQVLGQMQGNVTKAASALGIDRRTLQRKMRSFM